MPNGNKNKSSVLNDPMVLKPDALVLRQCIVYLYKMCYCVPKYTTSKKQSYKLLGILCLN